LRTGHSISRQAALASAGLFALAALATTLRGEEPGRLGRFLRFGAPTPAAPVEARPPAESLAGSRPGAAPRGPALAPPAATATPPRLLPQPRVSRAVTDADPIVTRVALGRADDGNQFGMFLQVYADGTVIDSEGVHRASRDALKEVVGALEQGDLYRIKGHCGTPSTDFVEQVQVVVYERSLGRLRANAFSFSGNTQGCDRAVQRLQTALDGLQARLLSSPAGGAVPPPASAGASPGPTPTAAPILLNAPDDPPA